MRISLVLVGLFFHLAFPGYVHAGWDQQSQTAFLELMCSSDSYFLKCFEMTKEKCRTDLKKSANECRNTVDFGKLKSKASMSGRGTGQSSGQFSGQKTSQSSGRPLSEKEEIELHSKIGLCAGLKVEKLWSDRKAASTECRKRENWQ